MLLAFPQQKQPGGVSAVCLLGHQESRRRKALVDGVTWRLPSPAPHLCAHAPRCTGALGLCAAGVPSCAAPLTGRV